MIDDFTKYFALKQSGSSPEDVYRVAMGDAIDPITRIRMIRSVFSLSFGGAKEVVLRAENEAASLDQHQEKIAEELIRKNRVKENI